MKIKENLFDMSTEEIDLSKDIYEGKVIKCLVAPYHNYAQLEKEIPFTKTTYLFPERELTASQLPNFISMLVNSKSNEEFRIITASQNIILDMVDGNVRILTEGGDIVPCPTKTFMANIHTIRHEVLENPAYQLSKEEKSIGVDKINDLIKRVQDASNTTISKAEYDALVKEVNLIGEPLIANIIKDMIRDITVK